MSEETKATDSPLYKVRFPVTMGGTAEGGLGLAVSAPHGGYDGAAVRAKRYEFGGVAYATLDVAPVILTTYIGTIDEHVEHYRQCVTRAAESAFNPGHPDPSAPDNAFWAGVRKFQDCVDHSRFSGVALPYEEAMNDAGRAECAAVRGLVAAGAVGPHFADDEVFAFMCVFGQHDVDLMEVVARIEAWVAEGRRVVRRGRWINLPGGQKAYVYGCGDAPEGGAEPAEEWQADPDAWKGGEGSEN